MEYHMPTTGVFGSLPISFSAFEEEISLTTTIGTPVRHTIRAYPNHRIGTRLYHPPQHGNIHFQSERILSYSPHKNFKGIDTFSCLLTNSVGTNLLIPFTISVKETKKHTRQEYASIAYTPPTPSIPTFTTPIGISITEDIPLNEERDQPYTLSLKKQATHGKASVYPDGTFTYTPRPNFIGTDHLHISQRFSKGDVENIPIEIEVIPPKIKKAPARRKKAPPRKSLITPATQIKRKKPLR